MLVTSAGTSNTPLGLSNMLFEYEFSGLNLGRNALANTKVLSYSTRGEMVEKAKNL